MLTQINQRFIFIFKLQYRTSRLLQSVAVRLRKHSKSLGDFGAWNRCLNHLLTLAESHIESVILAKFIEAVQGCFPSSLCLCIISFVYLFCAFDPILTWPIYVPAVPIQARMLLWSSSVIFMLWIEYGMTLEPIVMLTMWLLTKLR